MITATQILNLLTKAQELGISHDFRPFDDGYITRFYYNWGSDDYYHKDVFIKNDNTSPDWDAGDYSFGQIMDYFDREIEKQLAREAKAKKRKEFLESLTSEQRELLDM
jgi:hypothetical protein